MKRLSIKLIAVILLLLGCISPKQSYSYGTDEGHPSITRKALQLKKNLHSGDALDKRLTDNTIEQIIQSTVTEDAGTNPLRHFYNPDTGKGLFGGLFGYLESAKERAIRYYNEARGLWKTELIREEPGTV